MNEYYELMENSDLDVGEREARSWIWYCPECKALFGSKAIHGRTIFPWFGYHTNDGNCNVLADGVRYDVEKRASRCECETAIKRVRDVSTLTECIESHM